MDRRVNKKTGEELQHFLHFKRRGGASKIKKGKGSFSRQINKKDTRSTINENF